MHPMITRYQVRLLKKNLKRLRDEYRTYENLWMEYRKKKEACNEEWHNWFYIKKKFHHKTRAFKNRTMEKRQINKKWDHYCYTIENCQDEAYEILQQIWTIEDKLLSLDNKSYYY